MPLPRPPLVDLRKVSLAVGVGEPLHAHAPLHQVEPEALDAALADGHLRVLVLVVRVAAPAELPPSLGDEASGGELVGLVVPAAEEEAAEEATPEQPRAGSTPPMIDSGTL